MEVRRRVPIIELSEIEAIKATQSIIERLETASFRVKILYFLGSVSLLLLYLVFGSMPVWKVGFSFLLLSVICWITDAHYLQLKQQFEAHHRAIINGTTGYIDQWNFNPDRYFADKASKVMFSYSTIIYPIFIVILIILSI